MTANLVRSEATTLCRWDDCAISPRLGIGRLFPVIVVFVHSGSPSDPESTFRGNRSKKDHGIRKGGQYRPCE